MNKFIYRAVLIFGVVIAMATVHHAQDRMRQTSSQSEQIPRVEADETFELNIPDRHIVEHNFEASTSVGFATADQKNVRVQVGVSLRAQTIDVLLRNVTGTVRFQASVRRILAVVNSRSRTVPTP